MTLQPLFPQNKEVAGRHYWLTFHNIASMYPSKPTDKDRQNMKFAIRYLTENFVCPVCVDHGKEYLKKHPIDSYLDSKEKLSDYLCKWHNSIRKEQGKSTVDCSLILDDDVYTEGKDMLTKRQVLQHSSPSQVLSTTHPTTSDDSLILDQDSSLPYQSYGLKPLETVKTSAYHNAYYNTPHQYDISSSFQVNEKQEAYPDVKDSMEAFKRVSTKIITELCKKSGLPIPDIIYTPCPMHPETSCTSFLFDQKSGRNLRKPVIFLNPSVYGLRTITHEFKHYEEKMKGHDALAADEGEIDRMAAQMIEKEFPEDIYDLGKVGGNVQIPQRQASSSYPETRPAHVVFAEKQRQLYRPQQRILDPSQKSSWVSRYPFYAASLNRTNTHAQAGSSLNGGDDFDNSSRKVETMQPYEGRSGFASIFDSLYEPLSSSFGLSARDLNEAHTPAIISNIAQTIAQSQLSSLGSLATSLVLGLGLTAINVFNKSGMGYTDRKFTTELAANFLWDGIKYANPQTSARTMGEARAAGVSLSRMDWQSLLNIMTGKSQGMGMMHPHQGRVIQKRGQKHHYQDTNTLGGVGAASPMGGVTGGPFDFGPVDASAQDELANLQSQGLASPPNQLSVTTRQSNRYVGGGRRYMRDQEEIDEEKYDAPEDILSDLEGELDPSDISPGTPASTEYSGNESGNSINWWS